MTPLERIVAAQEQFWTWRAPSGLDADERLQARCERNGDALHSLIGWLRGVASAGPVSPEALAEAVEYALRERGDGIVLGQTAQPNPSANLRALGSCREERRGAWAA